MNTHSKPATSTAPDAAPEQQQERARAVRTMFGRIAGRYDLVNDLMTAGRHRAWKRATVAAAAPQGADVLDLGCGTGDIARALVQRGAKSVVGGDFTQEMLDEAERLSRAAGIPISQLRFTYADALDLPFDDASFDCLTSGFLVRNVADRDLALREMLRVLRPGGRVVCLEASRRDGAPGWLLHRGFGLAAPVVGWLVARDRDAYRYLPESAQQFASAYELAAAFNAAGFERVQWKTYGLGLIALHRGWKPRAST